MYRTLSTNVLNDYAFGVFIEDKLYARVPLHYGAHNSSRVMLEPRGQGKLGGGGRGGRGGGKNKRQGELRCAVRDLYFAEHKPRSSGSHNGGCIVE